MQNSLEVIIPFLNDAQIEGQAEAFRRQYCDDSVPVDIEKVVDVKLGINIIPIPKLAAFCDTDALITSAFTDLYVDYGKFMDERYQNRLRFSFSHEIGHLALHKDFYNGFGINSFDDYFRVFSLISVEQYGYLEAQANKFANHLLVPRVRLREEKEKLLKSKNIPFSLDKIDKGLVDSYLAVPLSAVFGVSGEVVEIALGQLK